MINKKRILSVLAGIITLLMLFGIAGDVLPKNARAATSSQLKEQLDELESQNDEIEAELKELRGQLSDNLDELTAMVAQKDLVDQEIALLHQQMENLNTQISAYSLLIADKQDELEKAQEHLSQLQIKNTTKVVDASGAEHPRVSGGKNLTEWTKLEVPFLYTDANTNLSINLNMQGKETDTGAVYFDLLQITELVEATADFTIEGSEGPMKAGEQIALKPIMTPANASTTIVWESLNLIFPVWRSGLWES